jgi:glutamate racemase
VFDSGLGGLTVVRQMLQSLPEERILFLADQAHVPYGGRDLAEVCSFACGISEGLFAAGCKAVVMACNISSATALDAVRSNHPDALVLGMIEPGARAAAAATRNGRIGVLATVGTVKSGAYTRTLHCIAPEACVLEVPCPEFVPLVETGALATPEARRAAETYLQPLLDAGTDTVVLGCTHYPFLLPLIQQIAPRIHFVDPAQQTVLELARELADRELIAERTDADPVCLTTTGDTAYFAAALHRFLPHPEELVQVTSAHWIGGKLPMHARD